MKRFWEFRAAADAEAELLLYGPIAEETWWGDEVTPVAFNADLAALGDVKKITVRVNSYGGDVFAAHAIYNSLVNHPARIVVRVDGIAASAATIVMLAGDEVLMPENAMIMIHNPWTITYGDARDLRKVADVLDDVRETILAVYEARTKLSRVELISLMNSETWMTADEAVDKGFADGVQTNEKIETTLADGRITINGFTFELGRFRAVPVALLGGVSGAGDNTGSAESEQTTPEEGVDMGDQTPVGQAEPIEEPTAEPIEEPAETTESAVARERARILAIQKLGNGIPGADEILNAAIQAGDSPEKAALALIESGKVRAAQDLADRKVDAAAAAGVDPAPAEASDSGGARAERIAAAGAAHQRFIRGGIS